MGFSHSRGGDKIGQEQNDLAKRLGLVPCGWERFILEKCSSLVYFFIKLISAIEKLHSAGLSCS